jgi:hypothetical protein
MPDKKLTPMMELNFNDFCKSKNCSEYIEWSFDMGANCTSCKLVGQSYNIDEYPKNCLFLDEIKKHEQTILHTNL